MKKKKGNNWSAYYDEESKRYFAEIIYTSREGREQYDYEITQDIFGRLGTFSDDIDFFIAKKSFILPKCLGLWYYYTGGLRNGYCI